MLDDQGSVSISEATPNLDDMKLTSPPHYIPNGSLGEVNGASSCGDWFLTFLDLIEFDTGVLIDVTLIFSVVP